MKSFFTTILYVPMYNLLMFLVAVVPGHQVGLAIILVTIILRLILLAPSIKATKSSLEMQKLQPILNQVRAKHKNNQAEMSKEMMRIFKE
ncbi:MAG: preprotein translocase subunit YidC, partial [Candidatus Berkelbacteria bacterium Athens1014_28]